MLCLQCQQGDLGKAKLKKPDKKYLCAHSVRQRSFL